MDENREESTPADDSMQSKGGHARAESLTPDERRRIAREAARARWQGQESNLPKANYVGELKIGNMSFPCSVLSDGTRVLTQSDFMAGMGMYYSGWVARNRSAEDVSAETPHFLSFSSLKPFISRHLGELQSVVVKYRTVRGTVAHGIKADTIPKICEIWMDADEETTLGVRQKKVAAKARILMRALAHVGIIALVDEATGYQEVRDRKALEALLDKFLRKELAAWSKRFPDEFYQQIFRLRGWQWKGMKVNRPQVVGHYTNDLVWDRIAPGLRKELQIRNPKDEKGNRAAKNHQWLTEDIGDPALARHLYALMGLQRVCPDKGWKQFYSMVQRAFPKKGDTLELDFGESEA